MDFSDMEPGDGRVLEELIRRILDMPPERRAVLLDRLITPFDEEDPDTKRDNARKSYNKPVYFDFENFTYTGYIKDLSTTGMFIETEETFQIGQMIMVNIPDSTDENQVRLAGEIVRMEPDGIGIQFITKARE
jgi:hypothetical protein